MAAVGQITVKVTELPQVQALLEDLERRVEAAEAVVEAARAWRSVYADLGEFGLRPEAAALIAAVDALDGAS